MKKINRKGLTMVELLAVVVIIGILASMSIIAYTKYINSAKKEKNQQNETTIENAAKIFLQNNQSYRPKSIGESVVIPVSELKENNYLKENITNENKESCMENSVVYVSKVSENNYSYKIGLYCGNEEANIENNNPEPIIENISFSSSEGLKNASFEFTIKGDSLNQVEIESYNYSFSITTDEINYIETYNSGSIPGNGKKEIKVDNMLLKDYIDLTSVSKVRLNVFVRNSVGKFREDSEVFTFVDTLPPICLSTTVEPEKEWLNYDDIFNKNLQRIFSVTCDDQDGSGCLRRKFTKKWGKELTESIENYDFVIEDNVGLKTTCTEKINIDIKNPEISVSLTDKNNNQVLAKSSSGTNNFSIEVNEYCDKDDCWLGGKKFNNVVFKAVLSDDLYIDRYTWVVSKDGTNLDKTIDHSNGIINNIPIDLYFNGDGIKKGILTVYDRAGNSTKLTINVKIDLTLPSCGVEGESTEWTKENRTINSICSDSTSGCEKRVYATKVFNSTTLYSTLNPYVIKDKAGNEKFCPEKTVNVYVDKTPPTCSYEGESTQWTKENRTISWKCYDGHSGCKDGKTRIGSKTFKTTTQIATIDAYEISDNAGNVKNCSSKNVSVYVDKTKPKCSLGGESTTWAKERTIQKKCTDSHSGCVNAIVGNVVYNSNNNNGKEIKTAKISGYTIKDKVGNTTTCSEKTANIYVDLKAPTCGITGTSTTWTNKNRIIKSTCSDGGSGCMSDFNGKTTTFSENTKTAIISGYTIKDKVGNETICPQKTVNVYVDKTPPTCYHRPFYSIIAWTKNDRTIYWYCQDTEKGVNESGCSSSYTNNLLFEKKYNTTTFRRGLSAKIYDKAGNFSQCNDTANVCVDKDPPYTPYIVEMKKVAGINNITYSCSSTKSNHTGTRTCSVSLFEDSSFTDSYEWVTVYASTDKGSGTHNYYLTYKCYGGNDDNEYHEYNNIIAGGITLHYKSGAEKCIAKYIAEDKSGNINRNNILEITYETKK